jgi:hypothetical protein
LKKNFPNDPRFGTSHSVFYIHPRLKAGKLKTAGKTAKEYGMKKFLIVGLIALTVAAQAFAGWGGPGRGPSSHGLPEAGDSGSDLVSVSISGQLAVVNGSLAVQDGSNTYFVKGLSRLMHSVPGLVVGAKVTLQGYSSVIMDDGAISGQYFKVSRITFNGTTYPVTY